MKHKNVRVGDVIVAKASAVAHMDIPVEKGSLCTVVYVEPLTYSADLTVKVSVDGATDWVNHKHFRKQTL